MASAQIHVLLTPGAEACGAEGLHILCQLLLVSFGSLEKKNCALSALPQLNQYAQNIDLQRTVACYRFRVPLPSLLIP